MQNSKIIETIENINTLLKDPSNIEIFIKFYEKLLSNIDNISQLDYINNLYCYFNQNTNKILIDIQKPESHKDFFIKMDNDLIELFEYNKDCYIAARDFLAMPAYKKSDKLEALTFIAEKGLENFTTISTKVTKLKDEDIQDYVYNHKLPFSILDLDQKTELTARWLEQVQPNKSKEFFETLDSFSDIKEKILNFEVNLSTVYDNQLRPLSLLQRMMEKEIISKSIYLDKISEYYELNKNKLDFDDISTLLVWICNTSIYKNPNLRYVDQNKYSKKQLAQIPKDILIRFSNTVNDFINLATEDNKYINDVLNEKLVNNILNPITEILEN